MYLLNASSPFLYQIYREILYRIYYFFLSFSLSSGVSWLYGKEIIYIYTYHLYNENIDLIFTTISEAFYFRISLCFFFSFILYIPIGGYSFFCYISPSLFPQEKKKFLVMFFWIFFSYVSGILISTLYIIPKLCSWFLQYGISTNFLSLSYIAKISTYYSWSKKMYIILICISQIPVIFWIFFSNRNKKVSLFLFKKKKFINLCILIFCAFLSPPDFYSQGFLFCFFLTFYHFFLWTICIGDTLETIRKKTRKL